jgi:DNA-binding NtrC family response regulator
MQSATPRTLDTALGTVPVTILVVDDDPAIRGFISEVLCRFGYHVLAVGQEQEAEEMLQRYGPTGVHLVITDVHLTTRAVAHEGYVLYQRWSASHPTLPFLLISGDIQSLALPAVQEGTVPLLPKPFTMAQLLAAVRPLLGN